MTRSVTIVSFPAEAQRRGRESTRSPLMRHHRNPPLRLPQPLTEAGLSGMGTLHFPAGLARPLRFGHAPGQPNRRARTKGPTMAKAATIKVKLVSTADTGYFYVTKKNSRTMTDKLAMKKYDPVAKKHVEFKEAKIK